MKGSYTSQRSAERSRQGVGEIINAPMLTGQRNAGLTVFGS
ncbi:MAG: hypothetical protein WBB45_12095 [Cyclobacteriaceae bacterium]